MKKYKLWEVIKMMAEDKSKVFRCLELENELMWKDDYLLFENGNELILNNYAMDYEWKLVKRAVTFEEVLNSNKKCRVEHELIDSGLDDEITSNDNVTLEDYQTLKEGNYMELHNLISVLPWILSNEEFKQVLKEGKWYLED